MRDDDSEIERFIWAIYTDFEDEMKMCYPFNPLSEYLVAPEAAFMLDPPPVINLPSGLYPKIAQQVFNNVINSAVRNGISVDYELVHTAIESINHSEIFVSKGKLMGTRLPDLNYNIGVVQTSANWEVNTLA